jgi:hypothetical protein
MRDEGSNHDSRLTNHDSRIFGRSVKVDLKQVEEACKELYIRALKLLPPDSTRRRGRSTPRRSLPSASKPEPLTAEDAEDAEEKRTKDEN